MLTVIPAVDGAEGHADLSGKLLLSQSTGRPYSSHEGWDADRRHSTYVRLPRVRHNII